MATERSREGGAHDVATPGDGVRLHHDDTDLTVEVPESLTISVDLPAAEPQLVHDEFGLAIDDVAVRPVPDPGGPATTSVTIVSDVAAVGYGAQDEADEPNVVPLPYDDSAAYSRRGRKRGEVSKTPENAAMLTAERLIMPSRSRRIPPEGFWQHALFSLSFHMINVGDSAKARHRKSLDVRISKRLEGGTRFVPILTRKGGVGKTTITTLLGMALADVREDRIIAIDANPDRGTLSERVNKQTRSTVRDLVNHAPSISNFGDISSHVSRDETRLDVLASDTDPMLSEAFDENDYNVVADLVSKYCSMALTDCGTGIVHSVMRATLQRADSVVIVSGGSVDEARLASETLTWLEANGYGALVRNAVVALNTATQGTNLVKLDEIEAHFRSRVREVVRIPYDPELAAGSVVRYGELKNMTRESARQLAALVLDGLPSERI